MTKILPVKYPRITCHQSFGSLLSILECIDDTEEWIYTNFIIMEAFSYIGGYAKGSVELVINPAYDFSTCCPWFWKSELSSDTINAFDSDIIEFIIKCIDTDNYVLLFVDESKFSCVNSKEPLFHDIFIYGYSREKKVFYTADLTFKYGRYEYVMIKFSEMSEAYSSAIRAGKNLNLEGAVKLWHIKDGASFNLDTSLIKDELLEYLNGYSYSNRYTRVYWQAPLNYAGINVYKFLKDNLDTFGMLKCLHNLYDHKKLMLERVNYLRAKGYISADDELCNEFDLLVKESQRASNLYVKYTITDNNSILERISDILTKIEYKEKLIYVQLIEELS
ncbi:MAG: hypothetical protein ACLTC0_07435 [Eisenbergiella massiliensis]|uniref:hypothetical protein n=1 Tax=Eisenbergiella massiliensis TaxID=1720294 RepID=UPI0039960CD9